MRLRDTTVLVIAFFAFIIAGFACTSGDSPPDYREIVKRELASGIRNDSLFLGYYFGMKKEEFYTYSWNLNKKEMVMQGPQNTTIEYQLDDNELPHPATMNFYPDFKNNRIFRMRTTFAYNGWAPWNQHLGADSLIYDVKSLMEEWYGNGFLQYDHPHLGLTFKKVDGNREIVITKARDDIEVNVVFTDLTMSEATIREETTS
ncbi:MAG: hypothetical protein R3281_05230 [Balneolaceae bacterium]|nr:hypothetical protein [Balneolaceae bacterium]